MLIRVIKVGGSVLDWPPLPRVLPAWLGEQPPARNVLLAGGGKFADVIRQADEQFVLGDEAAHWLCIDALSVSARLLAAILCKMPLICDYSQLRSHAALSDTETVVFDPARFLYVHEQRLPGRVLPHDWSVTSDSIAARLAEAIAADELVLLKSCDPPSQSLDDLTEAGFVDSFFAGWEASGVRIRFVNFREVECASPAN